MSTFACAFCGLGQPGRHNNGYDCIAALRAALAEARQERDEARRALELIKNRANDPSPFGPVHVLDEITERADAALAEPDGPR